MSPEAERSSPEFFNILNFVLGFCPPNPAETEIMARFAKLGDRPARDVRCEGALARDAESGRGRLG